MEVMKIINFKTRYKLFYIFDFILAVYLDFKGQCIFCINYSALEHDVLFLDVRVLFIYMYKMDNCLNTIFSHKDNIFMT